MKKTDWFLIWSWLLFLSVVGPFLFSARDWLLFAAGLIVLGALVYFTQRRVVPIIQEKFK